MPHIRRGCVTALYLFDAVDEIDLRMVESVIGAGTSTSRLDDKTTARRASGISSRR